MRSEMKQRKTNTSNKSIKKSRLAEEKMYEAKFENFWVECSCMVHQYTG